MRRGREGEKVTSKQFSLRFSKGNRILTFHETDSKREIIDKLVMAGLYISRSEFIRMAIEEKLQKTYLMIQEPFFELNESRREENET